MGVGSFAVYTMRFCVKLLNDLYISASNMDTKADHTYKRDIPIGKCHSYLAVVVRMVPSQLHCQALGCQPLLITPSSAIS